METNFEHGVIALAGIFQSAALVVQVACQGNADSHAYEASIRSIFDTEPRDPPSVYGGTEGVRLGLNTLIDQLSKPEKRNIELTRHVIAIIVLERKLARLPSMLRAIAAGIDKARQQAEHFSLFHENVIASLADLYISTISKLTPRIIVRGEHGHLSNPNNASKVRALLLAGIRSAVLWRQCGGNRWQLLLKRRQITSTAQHLVV